MAYLLKGQNRKEQNEQTIPKTQHIPKQNAGFISLPQLSYELVIEKLLECYSLNCQKSLDLHEVF